MLTAFHNFCNVGQRIKFSTKHVIFHTSAPTTAYVWYVITELKVFILLHCIKTTRVHSHSLYFVVFYHSQVHSAVWLYKLSNKYCKTRHDICTNGTPPEPACCMTMAYSGLRSIVESQISHLFLEQINGAQKFFFSKPPTVLYRAQAEQHQVAN